jgi:hypothetical protein
MAARIASFAAEVIELAPVQMPLDILGLQRPAVLKSDHSCKSQEHQNLYIFKIQYKFNATLKTRD